MIVIALGPVLIRWWNTSPNRPGVCNEIYENYIKPHVRCSYAQMKEILTYLRTS